MADTRDATEERQLLLDTADLIEWPEVKRDHKKAIAVIAELRRLAARLETAAWIERDERLPEIGQLIVTYYAAHDSYWVGRYHRKIGMTRWMALSEANHE